VEGRCESGAIQTKIYRKKRGKKRKIELKRSRINYGLKERQKGA
jgi:hypothetical protein